MKKVIIKNLCFALFASLCITSNAQSPVHLNNHASLVNDVKTYSDHHKLIAELQKDGLIDENKPFSISVKEGVLVINDVAILESADLYKSYIEKHPNAVLSKAKESNLTIQEPETKSCKTKKA